MDGISVVAPIISSNSSMNSARAGASAAWGSGSSPSGREGTIRVNPVLVQSFLIHGPLNQTYYNTHFSWNTDNGYSGSVWDILTAVELV